MMILAAVNTKNSQSTSVKKYDFLACNMKDDVYSPSDCQSFLNVKKDIFIEGETPSFYDSAIFLRKSNNGQNSNFEVDWLLPKINIAKNKQDQKNNPS